MVSLISKIIAQAKKNIFIKALIKLCDDDGLEYAGYMAYLNIFSIFPLFIILIVTLTSLGETQMGIKVVNHIAGIIPEYALNVIKPQLAKLINGPSVGVVSFVFIGAIWTTTSTLEGLRKIFNKIYNVKQPPIFIITRLVSIFQFLVAIAILLITLATFVLLPHIVEYIESILSIKIPTIQNDYLNDVYSLLILTTIIAAVYYSLINKKLKFISVIPGAFVTVLLWFLSGDALAYYVYNSGSFSVVYGSLAGVIIVLIFFYVINVALLYGAVLNCVLYRRFAFLR